MLIVHPCTFNPSAISIFCLAPTLLSWSVYFYACMYSHSGEWERVCISLLNITLFVLKGFEIKRYGQVLITFPPSTSMHS